MKAQPPTPPLDANHPVARYHRHNDPDWHWLEDRDDPSVRRFLNDVNDNFEQWFTPLAPLYQRLYHGHLARRELAVTSLATPLDHYVYWSTTANDADYPVFWRHPIGSEQTHECLLDLQTLSRESSFLELGDMTPSPDEQWLAWTVDTRGDEFFDLYVRQLPDGTARLLESGIAPDVCWAEDGRTLLFSRYDDTQRPASVWCRPFDSDEASCLFEERDAEFWVGFGKTRSRLWLVIETASKDTSECYLLPAHRPNATPHCVRPRESGVEYSLDHRPGTFYIHHNRDAVHFRLDRVAEEALLEAEANETVAWQTLIEHRDSITLEGVDAFSWGLVLTERDHDQAQVQLRLLEFDEHHVSTRDEWLPLFESPCSQALGDNPHFTARKLRLREESFTTPPRWEEINLDNGERQLLRQQPVHGSLRPEQLICKRLWATSFDGERVPVSIVARADHFDHTPLPTLLYGYGAYGQVLDPWFSISRLELLERGAAFAVAHVRGGGDRGEPWYLAGKLEHKQNSFRDFLAARNALVDDSLADGERIAAYGASAGGLLVAASVNLEPHAFCAAVLDVPFVDVLRTMENPELPLTTAEYTEWGNPAEPDVRRRISDYSPLDNLAPAPWPSVYLQGSWFDTRVPYWEPAKLYARLTELASARGPVLLRTDMEAGHGGASGRFEAWRDIARQDAFILWALGLSGVTTPMDERTTTPEPG
ncbi:S9 family peptidase [Kushneria phosphatilytica]|uniref:S9 family peptidase n=1 Tax=Kushneria phosphatilytica TaxID=657387 RepID=A0A5C1A0G4_9GAMM|nr:prolyl oligopeptidase family serine peptidase [Kushneria phosphatilytica]QEL11554.1 S9 family peptidase [Kushneria phosphatilytica]